MQLAFAAPRYQHDTTCKHRAGSREFRMAGSQLMHSDDVGLHSLSFLAVADIDATPRMHYVVSSSSSSRSEGS